MTRPLTHAAAAPNAGAPPSRAGRPDYVLPKVLVPEPDESLPGLMMRTAAIYGFHDPRRLMKRLELPNLILVRLCQEDPAGDNGRRIRTLLDLDEGKFDRLRLWTPDVTTVSILGRPVWRELVRLERRAVCPLCLKESPHHRAVWLVDLLPICTRHGVRLIDHCPAPECGQPLAWSGRSVHQCGSKRCRSDLRLAEAVRVEPERIGGLAALVGLLEGTRPATGALDVPFGPALKLSLLLGKMSFGYERRGRPPGFIQRESDRIPEILAEGWRALDNWPHGFHQLLDKLKSRAVDRAGMGGLRKAFGGLSNYVHEWAREPWGAPIGVDFARYSAAQPDLSTTPYALSRYAPGTDIQHPYVSMSAVQRELGIAPTSMIGIANRLNLFVLESRGSGLSSLLRADCIPVLKQELGRFLLVEEARVLLGIGREGMEQLELAGLIRRVPIEERIMESLQYSREEVVRFVDACVQEAPLMTKEEARRKSLTPLKRAIRAERSMVDLCRALRDGLLHVKARVTGAKGLASVRVDMEQVTSVLPLAKATLSMEDAGKSAGIRYNDLHLWAKRGLFPTEFKPEGLEIGVRVTPADWAKFRKEFVTGGDLARLMGQENSSWPSRHLKFLGIEPVGGPGVDGAAMVLFRAADCTSDALEAVRRVQAGRPGTPHEKHRRAFARVPDVAASVASMWDATFTRTHNCFTDAATGRTLQVISGRRPDMTGVYQFSLSGVTAVRLRGLPGVWVALVPSEGNHFLLLPFAEVHWRGDDRHSRYVTVRFDKDDVPTELTEWVQRVTVGVDGA